MRTQADIVERQSPSTWAGFFAWAVFGAATAFGTVSFPTLALLLIIIGVSIAAFRPALRRSWIGALTGAGALYGLKRIILSSLVRFRASVITAAACAPARVGRRNKTPRIAHVKYVLGFVMAITIAMPACTSQGTTPVQVPSATCNTEAKPVPVTCDEAALVAQGVAVTSDVWTQGPIATVKPYPVAQGRSDPTWWVTFAHMQYRPPSGMNCTLKSFYVMVDALSGQVLAHDVPGPSC